MSFKRLCNVIMMLWTLDWRYLDILCHLGNYMSSNIENNWNLQMHNLTYSFLMVIFYFQFKREDLFGFGTITWDTIYIGTICWIQHLYRLHFRHHERTYGKALFIVVKIIPTAKTSSFGASIPARNIMNSQARPGTILAAPRKDLLKKFKQKTN